MNADSRKNCERAFHRQSLSDHAARKAREPRPVRPELKLHRDSRDDAEQKSDSENLRPETCRAIVFFILFPDRHRFEINDQRRESHCNHREQVVISNGKSELKAMYTFGIIHK